jgi:hypothetical protein
MTAEAVICTLLLAGGPLGLHVSSPQRTVFVGEPIKLVVKWSTDGNVRVPVVDDRENGGWLRVRVQGRRGALIGVYGEEEANGLTGPPRRTELHAGAPVVTSVYLVFGGYVGEDKNTYIFRRPGEYSLTLDYRAPDGVSAASNTVPFQVEEPTGQEREVFEAIRDRPWILRGGHQVEELLEQHRASRYLQYAKVMRLWRWQNAVANGRDPLTGAFQGRLTGDARRRWEADHFRRLATGFLATDSWGAFEEERLSWAALYMHLAGDSVSAAAFSRELKARFPGTRGAKEVEGLGDQ